MLPPAAVAALGPKTTKAIQKWKPHLMEAKSWKTAFFSSSICSIISHGPFTAKFSQADFSFSLLFKVLLRISKWDLSDKSMCGCLHRGFLICFDSSRSKKSLFTCLFRGYLCLTLEISLGLFSPIVEGKWSSINDEVVFVGLLLDGFPRDAAAHKEWLKRVKAALHLRECNEKKKKKGSLSSSWPSRPRLYM